MREIALVDVHSHFLPGLDDGCKTLEESLGVLRAAREQGVVRIAATPHYYSRVSVAAFLDKRQAAYEAVMGAMDPAESWPEITLGAEVAYHAGLIYEEELPKLCYQGTNFLLLEMPFCVWTGNILRDVENLTPLHGVTPVIAHLERYMGRQNMPMVKELLSLGFPIQINAEHVLNCRPAFKLKHMLRSGQIDLLGSDCHNLTNRRPNMGDARDRLLSWGMGEELARFCYNGSRLFDSAC